MNHPAHTIADNNDLHVPISESIYHAGQTGIPWRVISGAVRLDRTGAEGYSFAGLALPGDVIGAEVLLSGNYAYEAHALDECHLQPWLPDATKPSGDALLRTLAAIERRAADALALRCGEAFDRVRRLFQLLAGEANKNRAVRIAIPRLKDMAEMTGLTVETVSRIISQLKKTGLLLKQGRNTGMIAAGGLQPAH